MESAVFHLVCDQSTTLATALVALHKECDAAPTMPRQCLECPGAIKVDILAAAIAKLVAAFLKGVRL